jgi:iron complex outermembrane receptor protein
MIHSVRAVARVVLSSTALLLCSSVIAGEPEKGDETIIVTGSKSAAQFGVKSGIPLAKMPQGVQVLTSDDLGTRGVVSMGDALRAVPSANVGMPRTSPYQSFSLKVRGFLADQMRNGVRQRYYEDVDASSMSNIERIEVLKGPSAALYGESAQGGIISIITKRPHDTFGWGGSMTIGSHERYVASFDVTGPFSTDGTLTGRLTGEIERSETFVDYQRLDRENFGLALDWRPSAAFSARLVAEWQERRTLRNPGLPVIGTIVSNGVGEVPRPAFLGEPDFSHLKSFAPLVQAWADISLGEGWTLTPRFSFSGFNSNFDQIRLRAMAADKVTVSRNGRSGKEADTYAIAQIDLSGSFETGSVVHKLLVGLEYDRERSTVLQRNIAAVPSINVLKASYAFTPAMPPVFVFAFDNRYNIDGVAAYAQDIVDVTSNWNVIAGARYSNMRTFNRDGGIWGSSRVEAWTWQLGTSYVLGNGWSVFGGYNTGFDIENSAGSRARTGKPFQPETSDQYEGGVRYASDRLSLTASLFQIRRRNVLTTDPLDANYSVQTGEVRVRGLEMQGRWQVSDELSLDGGYALMEGRITRSNNGDQGGLIGDLPRHSVNLSANWKLTDMPLALRLSTNYVSSRALVNGSTIRLPAYAVVDFGVSWDFDNVKLRFTLSNLFDRHYYTASGNAFAVYPGEPRQFSLSISRSF